MTWVAPKRKKGKDSQRTHYSREEMRMEALKSQGYLAACAGESRESNPCVSEASRNAWFLGWDEADKLGEQCYDSSEA